jgi:hypothetical protein
MFTTDVHDPCSRTMLTTDGVGLHKAEEGLKLSARSGEPDSGGTLVPAGTLL